MKIIKNLIVIISMILGLSMYVLPITVSATDPCDGAASETEYCKQQNDHDLQYYIKAIINTLLYVLGAIAVLMIIVAGIYYVISGGYPALVDRAKSTILYAVIGLIVALLAYAIVNFVIFRLK